jgi:hypothetical protein
LICHDCCFLVQFSTRHDCCFLVGLSTRHDYCFSLGVRLEEEVVAAMVASSACAHHSCTSVTYLLAVKVEWVHLCIPFHLDQSGSAWQ